MQQADGWFICRVGFVETVRALSIAGGKAAANVLRRTYPRGLDVEAMFIDTLRRMDRLGRSAAAREHVTIVARDGPMPRAWKWRRGLV